jgi:Zn ribbon nucleic-acid-binding protein
MEELKILIKSQIEERGLGERDVAQVFDSLLRDLFSNSSASAVCPYCEARTKYRVSPAARVNLVSCQSCGKGSALVTGKVRTKRFNFSSDIIEDWGVHLRFIDDQSRERYVHLRKFLNNPELKSKDQFSLCIGLDEDVQEGKASIFNSSIGKSYFHSIEQRQSCLQELEGLD